MHFLRNALDYVPRRVDDDCLQELRWLNDRRDLAEARRDLAAWLARWSAKYPRLTGWVEDNIDETLSFYRQHRYLNMDDLHEHKKKPCVVPLNPTSWAPGSLAQGQAAPCGAVAFGQP